MYKPMFSVSYFSCFFLRTHYKTQTDHMKFSLCAPSNLYSAEVC
jgi:hypothetical protein